MRNLNLEEFVYQVKKELLEAQEKHKGEPGYFSLRDVELELSVAAKYSGEGKLSLQVVQIGSEVAGEHVHKVKLTFDLVGPSIPKLMSQSIGGSYAPMGLPDVEQFGPVYQDPPPNEKPDLTR